MAAVLILQLVLIVRHEPWHDEWQAVLIALQSPGLAGLLDNLRYEGHPPLWYLLLQAAALVVPAAWVLVAVQAPVAVALQAIILFRSPFERPQRLLLAVGFFVLFEYGTLSRNLGLGALLTTVAFTARDRRVAGLALALMPQADFLFGALSVIGWALRWRDRTIWWPAVVLWAGDAALAGWLVRPAADIVPALVPPNWVFAIVQYVTNLSALLLPLHHDGSQFSWRRPLPMPAAISLGPLFLVFAWRQLSGRAFDRTMLGLFIALTAVISMFVYTLPLRHLSLIAWLLILLQWRWRASGGALPRSFGIWLAGAAACGLIAGGYNLVRPFHNGGIATEYIMRHRLQHETWAAIPAYDVSTVAQTGTEFVRLAQTARKVSCAGTRVSTFPWANSHRS